MTHRALSDDESDHENGSNLGQSCYAIVKEDWRSDKLIIWLRMIDLLACGEKWRERLVAPVGNGRRLRVHSTRSKPGDAVIGLPENCYNPDWLKSLNSLERRLLDVKPAFDMTFTSTERSCAFIVSFRVYLMLNHLYRSAAQYIPLAKGNAQPSTNPQAEFNPAISLDDWLLNHFGKVQDQEDEPEMSDREF
jgi:hypothetical protein